MVGTTATRHGEAIGLEAAWSLLLALRRACARGAAPALPIGLALDPDAGLSVLPAEDRRAWVRLDAEWRWSSRDAVIPAVQQLLELYLPLCRAAPEAPLAVAQLGQSLDGQVATAGGESHYVTGLESIVHLHRLRALADAVIVGAETAALDDPRLTTRLVPGPNPLRVVIDPDLRLRRNGRLFRDGHAASLVVCRQDAAEPTDGASVELLRLAAGGDGLLGPRSILAALHARGCSLVLVEGGGRTVSRFLEAGALDRLHLAIAPIVLGHGRPGLSLAGRPLREALRPSARRFAMGEDVLFDCDLRG